MTSSLDLISADRETLDLLTPAQEKQVAKALSPAVAWPTIALAIALPAVHWSVVALGLARLLPLWACAAILTVTAYAHYTLVHESIHGNLTPGRPRLRRLNDVVGWAGAMALGYNWPMMLRGHAQHHAHTNTEDDPDVFVRGTLVQLMGKWLVRVVVLATIPLIALKPIAPDAYRQATRNLRGSEPLQASAVAAASLALLAAAIATGHVMDWLCLLFIPTRVAGLVLNIFFQWLPHHPFDQTERYLNTRASLWPGAEVLTLQQNLHLVHHLWPSVPFYNYARLFERLRHTLIVRGSRIEGFLPGAAPLERARG